MFWVEKNQSPRSTNDKTNEEISLRISSITLIVSPKDTFILEYEVAPVCLWTAHLILRQ